jgi:hypothetical protein
MTGNGSLQFELIEIDRFRALELAIRFNVHIDTVLYFRRRYLKGLGKKEFKDKFIQASQMVT